MSRARLSVRQLAREADQPVSDVLDLLRRQGFPVRSPRSGLPRTYWRQARSVIALQASVEPRDASGGDSDEGGDEALAERPTSVPTEARPSVRPSRTPSPKAVQTAASPAPLRWKPVGRKERVELLSAEEVNSIHWQVVRDFARSDDPVDPPGIRDVNIFESAVSRPATSFAGEDKYPTVSMAGAALFHALVHNHPFHNGNKRTALVSLVVFLDRHGYVLTASQNELYDYVLGVAAHEVVPLTERDGFLADRETLEIARWLQRSMHRTDRREHPLQFRQLRSILIANGCTIEMLGTKARISREGRQIQISYGGDGREVKASTIHKVRAELELDERHGFDSEAFYATGDQIPDFILKYRDLLTRLAKV